MIASFIDNYVFSLSIVNILYILDNDSVFNINITQVGNELILFFGLNCFMGICDRVERLGRFVEIAL
jgi:hypothetical protein